MMGDGDDDSGSLDSDSDLLLDGADAGGAGLMDSDEVSTLVCPILKKRNS